MSNITIHQTLRQAIAQHQSGNLAQAQVLYRSVLQQYPTQVEALHLLGVLVGQTGQNDEAVELIGRAIALRPNYPEAFSNLGVILREKGLLDEAIHCYHKAIALQPNYAVVYINLGTALQEKGQVDEAIACFRKTISLKPDYAIAHNNLGTALKDLGQLDEAIASFRTAIALQPDYFTAHSNLLVALNYHPQSTASGLLQESLRWAQQHAEPLKQFITPHTNDRNPDRRLKIGYVSPDFREHVAGRALLPLLASHDHQAFEIFCYAQVAVPDAHTQRLRACADAWRSIVGMSDPQVAELIRQDQIDILIDLSGHSSNHRLLVFARKPAPVQVTWLGFPSSTGMRAIDYRITDAYLDPLEPPGQRDAFYTEQSIRLPQNAGCYQPGMPTPEVNELPALSTGRITFGCLNNLCKVTPPTLHAWLQILQAVPQSDLLLYAQQGAGRQHVRDSLTREGIDPQRVHFVGRGGEKYFAFYHQMDIALDPWPYTGSTTTCDALIMGVPVISRTGPVIVSRLSLTVLSNIGMTELVAETREDYVRLAVKMANDLPRLVQLRSTLRQRMQDSPLMDATRFTRNMEAAYHTMWRRWCQNMKEQS